MTSPVPGTQPDPFSPGPLSPGPLSPVPLIPPKPKQRGGGGLLLALAALVAVGGIAFAVGRMTAPAAAASTNGRGTGFQNGAGNGGVPSGSFAPGAFGRGGVGGAFGGITLDGTVTAVGSGTITVKTANGTETTIPTSSTTTYHQQQAATSGDVAVGATVEVRLAGGGFVRGAGGGFRRAWRQPGDGGGAQRLADDPRGAGRHDRQPVASGPGRRGSIWQVPEAGDVTIVAN